MNIGHQIRDARKAADLTQTELAEKVGLDGGQRMNQSTISDIETSGRYAKAWAVIQSIRRVLLGWKGEL